MVQIGQLTSKTIEIDFSVPQGSILGPILFNCYASMLMEVIPECKKSFLSGYAYDHAMIYCFSPDNKNIKQNIDGRKLKMNDAKTEIIVLGTAGNLNKNTLENIKIGDVTNHWTSKINFLECTLTRDLASKTMSKTDQKKPTTILS